MNVVFLPEAERDIERLYDFLLRADPLTAQKAMLAIDEGIALLLEHPMMGVKIKRAPDYRQLFIPFGKSSYVLRYRVHAERNELVVVRVWHGREDRND